MATNRKNYPGVLYAILLIFNTISEFNERMQLLCKTNTGIKRKPPVHKWSKILLSSPLPVSFPGLICSLLLCHPYGCWGWGWIKVWIREVPVNPSVITKSVPYWIRGMIAATPKLNCLSIFYNVLAHYFTALLYSLTW